MSETIDKMGDMHALLAKTLTDQITKGTKVLTKDGTVVKISASATVLNVARQFLRDNNIQCQGEYNSGLKELTESLPFNE